MPNTRNVNRCATSMVEEDLHEVHSPGRKEKSSSRTGQSTHHLEQVAYNDEHHEEGVRIMSQPPGLFSGPLREGLSSSDGCPSQA